MIFTASAPAKTILFGEHAVVYGEPAIAIPLSNTRTTVEIQDSKQEFRIISSKTHLNHTYQKLSPQSGLRHLIDLVSRKFNWEHLPNITITIQSDIPIASGLGSGAALSVALIRSLAAYQGQSLDTETINQIAYEVEKIYHGTPSGIDNTVITYEQPIVYQRGHEIIPLKSDLSKLHLIVADTGIRSRTVDVVSDVRAHYPGNEKIIQDIGQLVHEAISVLETSSIEELGRLMNENHQLLKALNVSCPELDIMIQTALEQGAPGAKLTGAGRGGNFLVLAQDEENAQKIRSVYRKMGVNVIL